MAAAEDDAVVKERLLTRTTVLGRASPLRVLTAKFHAFLDALSSDSTGKWMERVGACLLAVSKCGSKHCNRQGDAYQYACDCDDAYAYGLRLRDTLC